MEQQERELLVSRLISGKLAFELDNDRYYFLNSTIDDKFNANVIYQEKFEYATCLDMFYEEDFKVILHELDYWTVENEARLEQLGKEIEEFKVKLFELIFKTNERKTIRAALEIAKKEQLKMLSRKHHYDHMTIEGFALSCKIRHLLINRLRNTKLERIVAPHLSDRLLMVFNSHTLNEEQIRDIARNEPWRTIWLAGNKNANVFNCHPYELNEEQKMLLVWSITYDNIYQNSECPHETVIEDDDMLDGWMIIQRRKREKELAKKEGEGRITNPKIRNAQEIFIPVDTQADADKVESLNDIGAKIMKQKKMNLLKKKGTVSESDMPDSVERKMMEMARLGREANVRRST